MRAIPRRASAGTARAAAGCALLFLLLSAGVAADRGAPERSVTVGGTRESLTVIAEEASLHDVLSYVAHHQRLAVEAHVALDEAVRVEIVEQPLPRVIRRLLRDYNFTLVLDPDGGSRGGRLWVHPRADAATRRLPQAELFGASGADDRDAALQRLAGGSDAERLEGAAVLAAWGGDDAFVALADALADTNPDVREEAVVGLADHFPDAGVPLVGAALADGDGAVREAAVDALADIGSEAAVAALAALLDSPDTERRRRAVHALGEVESAAATAWLRRAATDPDARVRDTARAYLEERGQPR